MKDLFSKQASTYAAFRPSYPQELIDYVCSFVPEKKHAWDCATGNGQAAALLSPLFEKITATDISEKQLQLAIQKLNIKYATGKAAPTDFPDNTFDLIIVAQAYHWFPFDLFEKEVKRVGKPGSIIAVWGYNIPLCNNDGINAVVRHFYKDIMGPYWDAERKYVDDFYKTVPFAFDELPAKSFSYPVQWTSNDLPGYFNSWSSVMNYISKHQHNPVDEVRKDIEAAWPPTEKTITFSFPIFLRIGRVVK